MNKHQSSLRVAATMGITFLVAFFLVGINLTWAGEKKIEHDFRIHMDGDSFPARLYITADVSSFMHDLNYLMIELSSPRANIYCEFTLKQTHALAYPEGVTLEGTEGELDSELDRECGLHVHLTHAWLENIREIKDRDDVFYKGPTITSYRTTTIGSDLTLVFQGPEDEAVFGQTSVVVRGATGLPEARQHHQARTVAHQPNWADNGAMK